MENQPSPLPEQQLDAARVALVAEAIGPVMLLGLQDAELIDQPGTERIRDWIKWISETVAVLPAPTDQTAVTCSAQHHRFDDGRLCIRAAQHSGDHIDERGYHWSDTVAVYPLADGQFRTGANVRDALRRMAGGAQQAPADRAAVLLEAADELDRYVGKQSSDAAPEVAGARLVIRELRRIAGHPSPVEEGKCGCYSPSRAYRCTQPAGHLGYHRHTQPDTDEWSSWITGTTEAELRRMAGGAQQDEPTESVLYEVVGDWGVDSADSAEGARAAVAKWLRAYPKCGAHAQQRVYRGWPDGSEFYGPWTDLPDQSTDTAQQPKEA